MAANDRQSILFVDDEPFILSSIRRSIQAITDEWDLVFANSGAEALQLCDANRFDLIVTDAKMPHMEGNVLLQRLRDRPDTNEVPTIMLTGYAEETLRRSAIDAGVIEFLNKPINSEELVVRLRNVLRLKTIADELRRKNEELRASSQQIIRRLGKAAEYRDNETGRHVIRVAHYSRIIAEGLKLDTDTVELIFQTAPMHDIGKIGIPDEVLKKKEKLKPIEFEVIKRHSLFGNSVLQPLNTEELAQYNQHMQIGASILGEQDTPLLRMAASIALTHHEKWDGSGYPHGLAGDNIPLEGRIVAIADIFDALTSKRYYKPAIPFDQSVAMINEMRGSHLDPAIVDCFNANLSGISEVAKRFADESKGAEAQ
jgi:putative two-component system response regulator